MSEQKKLNVEGLRDEIREPLKNFGQTLVENLGETLQSLIFDPVKVI